MKLDVVIARIYAAKKKNDTDTDTSTLSRIGPGKRYTLRVNWPGFKGLKWKNSSRLFWQMSGILSYSTIINIHVNCLVFDITGIYKKKKKNYFTSDKVTKRRNPVL